MGSNYGSVKACWSSATVHNDYRRAGGIVGYNAKEVADMEAHGTWNTRGEDHIAAESTEFVGSVADCFFIGYASSASQEYSGGIAATCDPECTIVNCYWLEGSSADDWGYYQEAEGATASFDGDGHITGTATKLIDALNNDAFVEGAHFPKLWWASAEGTAAAPAEEAPAEEEAAQLTIFGAPAELAALKAYETEKTLVKSGKNGDTEVAAKGITATDLIEKIGGFGIDSVVSLTFTAADGFSATVEKPEAGWDEVMLIWDGDGASDESLKSAVNGGGGKVWVNGVVTVEAETAAQISIFGAPVAVDALKAYETEKTLVKSGKSGDTEVAAKGITATDLIEKIGGFGIDSVISLSFTAADGFSAKVEKPEAGWDEVMLIWEGSGASDDSLYSAVNYGSGKMWVSGVVTVEAEKAAIIFNGTPVTLAALKAYETEKTLVKAGKNGETEVAVKGITAEALIAKVAGSSAELTSSLTFTAADGFSATVEKPEAGWDEVMLIWDGDGASDGSLKSAVNGGGGKVWVNNVVTVEAVGGKEVCLAVCLKNGKDGEAVLLKEYDKAELQALAAKNEAGWAYLYYKGEAWASIVATVVVELDALLADAGAAESWTSGAWLEFTCSDGVYGKSYPSYDDIAAKNLFVGEDGSSLVPAGLAITWNSGNLDPVTAESVAALAATAYDSGSLRFVYGMTEAQYTDESNAPAGARMPTGVLILTVVSGEEAPEGTVGTSKDNTAFTDIAGNWAEADILAAAKMGLVKGMGDGLFQPDTALSRAMMAQILYRVVGEPKVAGVGFEDVTEANWYYAPAAWAEQTGIVSDFAQNTFEGRKAITREEIAAMLYRCAAAFGLDTSARAELSSYTDAGEVSAWAQDAMSWAVAAGVMEGRTENTLAPAGTATRAEAVTLLMRVLRIATGQPG